MKRAGFLLIFILSFHCTFIIKPELVIAHANQTKILSANQYFSQAKILSKKKNYLEAAQSFVKAAEAEKKSAQPHSKKLVLYLIYANNHFFMAKRYDLALQYAQEGLKIAKSINHKSFASSFLHNIGAVYQKKKHYIKAIDYFNQSLTVERQRKNVSKIASRLWTIAETYNLWKKYDKAMPYYRDAIEVTKTLKRPNLLLNRLNIVGRVYEKLNQKKEAMEYYQQELSLVKKNKGPKAYMFKLSDIGQKHYIWRQYEQAINYYKQAIKLAQEPQVLSPLNSNLANCYRELKQYEQAIHHFNQALKIDKQAKNAINVLFTLKEIASTYHGQNQYSQAIEYYTQALTLAKTLKKPVYIASALNRRGESYRYARLFDRAIEDYKKALKLYTNLNKTADIATIHNNMGLAYEGKEQFKQALFHHQTSLRLDRKLKRQWGIAHSLSNIGDVYKTWGNFEKALPYFEESLSLFKQLKDNDRIASLYNNLGNLYNSTEQFDKALNAMQQALKLYRQLNHQKGIATALSNLGSIYSSKNQFDKALQYYQQALALRKAGSLGRAASLNSLGTLYHTWGKYTLALNQFQEALKIFQQAKTPSSEAITLSNIGQIYNSWGKNTKALYYYQQALKINQSLNRKDKIASSFNNIASIYFKLNQFDQALQYYQQALKIDQQLNLPLSIARTLNNMGLVYREKNQLDLAHKHISQALAIDKKHNNLSGMSTRFNNLGNIYSAQKQYAKAIDSYQQSLILDRKLKRREGEAITLTNMGGVYNLWQKPQQTLQYLEQAISLFEEIRSKAPMTMRRNYLAKIIQSYRQLIYAHMALKNDGKAFIAIEQSHARQLKDQLQSAETSPLSLQQLKNLLNSQTTALIYANSSFSSEMPQLSLSRTRFNAQNVDIIPILKAAKAQFALELQQVSQNNKTLLASRGVKMLGEKSTVPELPEGFGLYENLIYYYRQLLTRPTNDTQQLKAVGNLLYKLFIKPHLANIQDTKELLIIPDGILSFIPFEALVDDEGKYLAESYNIRYIQSMGVLKTLNQRHYSPSKTMLAFGGANYQPISYKNKPIQRGNSKQFQALLNQIDQAPNQSMREIYGALSSPQWSELPGTLQEIKSFNNQMKQVDIIEGEQVNEQYVKQLSQSGELAKYKILHFATHGLVSEIPELSALVLSQFKTERTEEDGYLRMNEIAQLKLQADFVNLSACETGLGKLYGGEGVVGLTQAFLLAGANGVSVSLWQVNDTSTMEFMKNMYAHEGTYYQKMVKTKRSFIKGEFGEQYKHPYYWAPFVYYGK